MSKAVIASLAVDVDRSGWYLVWNFDGEEGATLGEDTYAAADLAKAKPEDWDHISATITAGNSEGVKRHGLGGYRWESERLAKSARRAVMEVLRDKSKKPWPEWATKAVANGWKPPKGWKP